MVVPQNKSRDTRSSRVTITQVAQEAGVSIAAVSSVLSGKQPSVRIAEATRQKIQDVANRLGYQANPFAAALHRGRTGVIGALIRDINGSYLGAVIRSVQDLVRSRGMELLISSSLSETDATASQLSVMQDHLFDGLLIIGDVPNHDLIAENLRAVGKLFVSLAIGAATSGHAVRVDGYAGTMLALDYLYDCGHRRIAFLGNGGRNSTAERLSAYRDFLKHRGLVADAGLIQTKLDPLLDLAAPTETLLALPEPPTAIFCTQDMLAVLLLRELYRRDLRVPDDISVMGYDDSTTGQFAVVPLTTIRQPADQLGRVATELLLDLIETPAMPPREILIQPQLVVRSSTRILPT